jgi:DNA-directed RNA polymerase subunit F
MAEESEGKIGESKPVPLAVVRNLLAKREREGELHYEQKLALDYAKKFAKLDQKEAEDVIGALMKLEIPRFKERHAVKLVDIMPEDKTAVRAVFSKESITLNPEQTESVLKILNKHRPVSKEK